MSHTTKEDRRPRIRQCAFTLIEVLVVVSIIALLIAILLPSLNEARRDARAVQCAANTHHIGQATAIYVNRSNGKFPAAYLYPYDKAGNWRLSDQYLNAPKPEGYLHWSYFLYSEGRVDEKAFQCPEMENGGHPRTNPGGNGADWVAGQVDDTGSSAPGQVMDKQATWMSYTGNAAIMSRNKFVQGSKNDRYNVFVGESNVNRASDTILATEFTKDFNAVSRQDSAGRLSKSHRPIHPFYDKFSSGFNLYASGAGKSRAGAPAPFQYGSQEQAFGGLKKVGELNSGLDNAIDDEQAAGVNKLNCVGRHHPGGGLKEFGGTGNFLYIDGHAERTNVLETMAKKQWGDAFYSVAGDNRINLQWSHPDIAQLLANK